jgi:hypothetical protein
LGTDRLCTQEGFQLTECGVAVWSDDDRVRWIALVKELVPAG